MEQIIEKQIIMAYQKCPVCDGTGLDPNSIGVVSCPVCGGSRIIDEITGRPPYKGTTTTINTCGNLNNNNLNRSKE